MLRHTLFSLNLLLAALLVTALPASGQEPAPPPSAPEQAPQDYLRVIGRIPLDDEALEQRMVFFFDRELAAPDEMGIAPQDLVAIQPEVEREVEVRENHLVVRLQDPAATVYDVTLHEGLKARDGRAVDPGQRSYRMSTIAFKPERVFPVDMQAEPPVLGVYFTASVTPDALEGRVTARDAANKELTLSFAEGTNAQTIHVTAGNQLQLPIRFRFEKGLTSTEGIRLAHGETLKFPFAQLQVRRVAWGAFEPDYQTVQLQFSAPVAADALMNHLKLTDALKNEPVDYSMMTEGESDRHEVSLDFPTPSRVRLEVALTKGLASSSGNLLENDYSTVIERRPQPIMLGDMWWQEQGKDGNALYMRLSRPVNLSEVEEHLVIEPAAENVRVEPTYGNSFLLYADWNSDTTYTVRLTAGLVDRENIPLPQDVTRQIRMDKVAPYIGIGFDGKYYFPRRTEAPLPILSRNRSIATARLYKMFPNNVAIAVTETDPEQLDAFVYRYSREIAKQDIDLVQTPDRLATTPLDVQKLFPADVRGVFCLELRDDEWRREQKLVVFTDMGLLAHWQEAQLALFAHDLFTLEPLALTKVTVYSDKNQVLGEGNTDESGVALLGPFDTSLGTPRVVVAERENDYTFLELTQQPGPTNPAMTALEGYNRRGYEAFLYADRNLYRPGETVHLRWAVRQSSGDALGHVPLLMTVTKPNGTELVKRPTVLSPLGTGEFDLETLKAYPTGRYNVALTIPGSQRPIGSYGFSLEEFVPNRIKTDVAVEAPYFEAGQEYPIQVAAQHLFGAPAADRKVEAEVILLRGEFQPKEWPGYTFMNDTDYQTDRVSLGEQQTDENGVASFTFKHEAPAKVTFPLKAVAVGRVFELGGRAVASKQERPFFPANTVLGVQLAAGEAGDAVNVGVAAVKPDGAPATLAQATVTLERERWYYYMRRYYSHDEPNVSERWEKIDSREVTLADGKGVVQIPLRGYGNYRIRVHSDQTPLFATQHFYAYGRYIGLSEQEMPSLVKIMPDKKSYKAGEDAVVRLESPFDGQGVVVLQDSRIRKMIPVKIVDGVGTVQFTIERDYFPSLWVEATVIHVLPDDIPQVYPFSSFGMESIEVSDDRRRLEVALPDLPEEIVPDSDVEIKVKVAAGDGIPVQAEVTLAAVDEGIHIISGYKSPDPYAWLSRPRSPDYRRAHYYNHVAYEYGKPTPGSDAVDAEALKRIGGDDETWIKTVALWSGPVTTDANGEAVIRFHVPEFTGQLRFDAVAVSEEAMGATSQNAFIRRKYMMRTSMPRFLLPGDEFQARVVLFNNSDADCQADVTWTASGALTETRGSRQFAVPAHGEASALAPMSAGNASGQGRIVWEAVFKSADGAELQRLSDTAPLPVRPPAAFQSRHELVVLQPGESRTFRNTAFIENNQVELEMNVAAFPEMRLQDALKFVVGYPYGCVEQTTSRLMPMYALRASAIADTVLEDDIELDNYLQVGIERLFSMQTSMGGLGFWPGSETAYPYGSIYALHFLTLVKQGRQFALPKDSFDALQDYVRGLMDEPQGDVSSWPYYPTHHQSILYQRAYATFVLALDGDPKAIEQIARFDNVAMPRAARLLLAAALAQNTKDADRVRMYLSQAPSEPYHVSEMSATLNSEIRNEAVTLLAELQIGADPVHAAESAEELLRWLGTARYGNTQETAFVVTALAHYFGGLAQNVDAAKADVAAPGGVTQTIAGKEIYADEFKGPGGEYTVNNGGQGNIYVDFTSRGVPEQFEWTPVNEGLAVTRELLSNEGGPSQGDTFRHGESYIVAVHLKPENILENVVVADLLPAGFEVENPRLDTTLLAGTNLRGAISPSFLEIRDDRVVLAFDRLDPPSEHPTHVFYYVVRAVTPGAYLYPPIEAECMYDPRVRSVTAPTTVRVDTGR